MGVSIEMTSLGANRHTRVVIHVFQHVGDRCLTLSVNATSEFADQTDLLVVTEPLGGCNEAL